MTRRVRYRTASVFVLSVSLAVVGCASTSTRHSLAASPLPLTLFEQAPVVAIVEVDTRTERIATNFEGENLKDSNGRLRTYWSNEGQIVREVRLNGKNTEDPDLFGGVTIEQAERGAKGIKLELGRSYFLLLRRSTRWYWEPECSHGCTRLPAPFELTTEQGGYEVLHGRLRVLRRGGPLDAFDGKEVDELIAALTKSSR
jgi:hypothetical protein